MGDVQEAESKVWWF